MSIRKRRFWLFNDAPTGRELRTEHGGGGGGGGGGGSGSATAFLLSFCLFGSNNSIVAAVHVVRLTTDCCSWRNERKKKSPLHDRLHISMCCIYFSCLFEVEVFHPSNRCSLQQARVSLDHLITAEAALHLPGVMSRKSVQCPRTNKLADDDDDDDDDYKAQARTANKLLVFYELCLVLLFPSL